MTQEALNAIAIKIGKQLEKPFLERGIGFVLMLYTEEKATMTTNFMDPSSFPRVFRAAADYYEMNYIRDN